MSRLSSAERSRTQLNIGIDNRCPLRNGYPRKTHPYRLVVSTIANQIQISAGTCDTAVNSLLGIIGARRNTYVYGTTAATSMDGGGHLITALQLTVIGGQTQHIHARTGKGRRRVAGAEALLKTTPSGPLTWLLDELFTGSPSSDTEPSRLAMVVGNVIVWSGPGSTDGQNLPAEPKSLSKQRRSGTPHRNTRSGAGRAPLHH